MDNYDVLQPEIRIINGSHYRINPINEKYQLALSAGRSTANGAAAATAGYVEHGLYEDDDDEDDIPPIEELRNGKYKLSYHVPKVFYSYIIGARGVTKKRLETDTRSQITVPHHRSNEEEITIQSVSRSNVCSAWRKIHAILLAARNKMQPTHFVSIPLTKVVYTAAFLKFKEDVLGDDELHVDPELFQNPDKFHLTISIFALVDNDERSLAVELLQACKGIVENRLKEDNLDKLQIHLKGLDIMNDDPQSTRVLYAKAVDCDALQQISDQILQMYTEKGFAQRESQVKLHATLMNTTFTNSDKEKHHRPIPFDSRGILAKYGDYDFGTAELTDIHLSQRFTTASDGFYEATSIVRF